MKVLLLRHGQRKGEGDELTLTGHQQARDLVLNFMNPQHWLYTLRPTRLFCSPKNRCRQTLTPLSQALSVPITISELVDERKPPESMAKFSERVILFISQVERSLGENDALLICTHFDWLEEFIALAPTDLLAPEEIQHFAPGEIHGFEITRGVWCYQGPRAWA